MQGDSNALEANGVVGSLRYYALLTNIGKIDRIEKARATWQMCHNVKKFINFKKLDIGNMNNKVKYKCSRQEIQVV